MKSVTFETMNNGVMAKEIPAATFENGVEHSIVDDIQSTDNPFLTMITRESMSVPESLARSQVNSMVMIEAKRLVMNEKINTLRWKRQQELFEMELKKFQNKLCATRPKFGGLTEIGNSKQQFSWIDNKELFMMNKKINLAKKKFNECNNFHFDKAISNDKNELIVDQFHHQSKEESEVLLNTGGITVVIKDKPIIPSPEENQKIMRYAFNSLRAYVSEAKRLRQVKAKIQQNIITGKLRRFFNAWRNKVKHSKQLAEKNKEQCEMRDVKKIEVFVNMIKEKQKILENNQRNNRAIKKNKLIEDDVKMEEKNKKLHKDFINTAEPFNNRLKVQKKIIAEQKIKLAEQNRLIEEMKLKQMEIESRMSGIETINIAKTILNNCGSTSRRILMTQFIRENDYEKKNDIKPPNSLPTTFPERLEARALARKQKLRERQVEREKKLYEEKLKEEAMKIEEEKIRKQLQRDAEREAKLIREEQERKKAESAEKMRILNESADNFYRKYLLRNYIIKPLILFVQISHNKFITAAHYCDIYRLRKTFIAWKNETKKQIQIKLDLSIYTYNRNLLFYYFRQWRETTKNEIRKYQVACDVYDLRIQEKYFNIWKAITIEMLIKNMENEKIAVKFSDRMIKKNYFIRWKKYMTISDGVKESDKRRDQWRQLVQMVIPDFAPKYRGVLIDD